jgi:ubiquitin carboxyl-terminal hydrolase 14
MTRSFEASLRTAGQDLDNLLNVELEQSLQCIESEQEPITVKREKCNKIVCNIVGGGANNTDHLRDGIKVNFEGTTEKYSNILQRDALWSTRQKISQLPKYLCVQFMRFFFKATPDSADHQGVKCKIGRAVSFPMVIIYKNI